MEALAPLLDWIETHPVLFATAVGMIVSSYLILTLITRLGGIKPSIIAFMLSGVVHVLIAVSCVKLATPVNTVVVPKGPEFVSIRDIVVEDTTIPEDVGADGVSVDGSTAPQQEAMARTVEVSRGDAPAEAPGRSREVMESQKRELPGLPPSEVASLTPQPQSVASAVPRNAVEQFVDLPEATAESRAEVVLNNTAPARTVAGPVGTLSEPSDQQMQREARLGNDPRADVRVKLAQTPSLVAAAAEHPAIKHQTVEPEAIQKSVDPAEAVVKIDDFGVPDGKARGGVSAGAATGVSAGSENAPKFTRAGRPASSRDGTPGTMELSRSTGRVTGGEVRRPAMASLSNPDIRGMFPLGENPGQGERPGLNRPNFNAIPSRESVKIPETYSLRNLPRRQKVAVQLGATPASEQAVELSLRWLAVHQSAEGYWDADGFDAHCPVRDRCWGKGGVGSAEENDKIKNPADRLALQTAGQQADTGLTALVVLTFLGAGYTQEEGQYADQVDRAVRWLVRQQQSNGFLGGKANHYERMYCHGMATYALGEASGMMADPASDPQLRQALVKAVKYIISMQNPNDGGWRYIDGHLAKQEGDMSMFGWQLMALKSSQIAGIEIPDQTHAGMVKFLKRISLGDRKGLASYRFGEAPKPSMTAEALFARQMLGMKRDNPSSVEAIEYLMKHPPRQTEQDLYYWYYGTLAMYQYGGEPWVRWNDQLRDTLVATQRKTGHAAGSWDPRDNWSLHGGRLYSTALSTLCLEVYYRFLPLYQLNGVAPSGLEN